jgi:hypothetical protein
MGARTKSVEPSTPETGRRFAEKSGDWGGALRFPNIEHPHERRLLLHSGRLGR